MCIYIYICIHVYIYIYIYIYGMITIIIIIIIILPGAPRGARRTGPPGRATSLPNVRAVCVYLNEYIHICIYIYIYIHTAVYSSLSLSTYIDKNIYIYMYMYVYIYIYIYMYGPLPVCITRFASQRAQPLESLMALPINRKGARATQPWQKVPRGEFL